MNLTPVKSSNVKALGFDPANGDMTVEFHSGDTYVYHQVGAEEYEKFLKAPSIGSHFHNHIRGHFKYTKPEKAAA